MNKNIGSIIDGLKGNVSTQYGALYEFKSVVADTVNAAIKDTKKDNIKMDDLDNIPTEEIENTENITVDDIKDEDNKDATANTEEPKCVVESSKTDFSEVKDYYGIKGTETPQELKKIRDDAYKVMSNEFKKYQKALKSNKPEAKSLGISAEGKQKHLSMLDNYIKSNGIKEDNKNTVEGVVDEDKWITMNGAHILVDDDNKIKNKKLNKKINGSEKE